MHSHYNPDMLHRDMDMVEDSQGSQDSPGIQAALDRAALRVVHRVDRQGGLAAVVVLVDIPVALVHSQGPQ